MVTIQTIATVTEEGTITAKAPGSLAPGQHQIVIVIDEQPLEKEASPGSASTKRFPDLAEFRESLGVPVHPGNTIVEMREDERS